MDEPSWPVRRPLAQSSALVEHWVQRTIDLLADRAAFEPGLAIVFLSSALGLSKNHFTIHVYDSHHIAGRLSGIGAGSVEGVAVLETDFAQVKWATIYREI